MHPRPAMTRLILSTCAVLCALVAQAAAQASGVGQAVAAARVMTLPDALLYALDHYPTVRAALEQVNASSAGVDVAKAAYLPRLDGVVQVNRATVNNVTGLLLPQSTLPGISGPPLPSASSASA